MLNRCNTSKNNISSQFSPGNIPFGNAKPGERVVIIDDFNGTNFQSGSDVNNDGIPELWHGQKIKGAMLSAGKNEALPEIEEIQSKFTVKHAFQIIKQLIQRNSDNTAANDVHMVNKSNGLAFEYKEIHDRMGVDLTPDNIKEKKNIFIKDMCFTEGPEDDATTVKASDYLSSITELTKTAKFYAGSGNSGNTEFLLSALADGVKSIGGLDDHGRPHPASGRNSLMGEKETGPLLTKNWAPYLFTGMLIKDKNDNPVGYDIAPYGANRDGSPDILLSEIKLSSDKPPSEFIFYEGTSYSAPYKLAKDYLARQQGEKEWNPF